MVRYHSLGTTVEKDLLTDALAYRFSDPTLLTLALTHSSSGKPNYERLEFLGDRVLDLAISEWLLELYPDRRENFLTAKLHNCVCRQTQVMMIQNWELESEIRHALKGKIPLSVLAAVCEAVVGAVYLDGGLKSARNFIRNHWFSYVSQEVWVDSKQALQEWSQKYGKGLPVYRLIGRKEASGKPWFEVEVLIGLERETGQGPSLRLAKKEAAKNLLAALSE